MFVRILPNECGKVVMGLLRKATYKYLMFLGNPEAVLDEVFKYMCGTSAARAKSENKFSIEKIIFSIRHDDLIMKMFLCHLNFIRAKLRKEWYE